MVKQDIEAAIAEALAALGAGEARFVVERPGEMEHGDYATNAALAAAKILKKAPREVAELLAARFVSRSPSTPEDGSVGVHVQQTSLPAAGAHVQQGFLSAVDHIEIAGAGFINFFLTREAIVKEVEAAATKQAWGSNDVYKGKKVMIDYTQPNPFKPFHIGHLMSNAIGESLATLFEQSGAKVWRVNYQGDVGPHVAKALWGMKKLAVEADDINGIGRAYVEGTNAYESDPEAKLEIDEINKKVYQRDDAEINALYDGGRKASLEHFEELYRMLGTTFDEYYFESESWKPGLASVKKHIGDVFEESQGAIIFPGEKYGLNTRVFVTSAGLPTYEGKEIGLIDLKFGKHDLDLSIVETAVEQKNMFEVAFKAATLINPSLEGKLKHVYHGLMRFADGKMASRKGNVITGESLLMGLKEDAKVKMEGRELADADKTAEQIAVGAIKYTVLRQGSGRDIVFDPAKSLSLEGDSGPYLQYAHTRALSLIKAAHEAGVEVSQTNLTLHKLGKSDFPSGSSVLERTLLHYPEVVAHAAEDLEPHYVTTYLTELASAFNGWYAGGKIIGSEHEQYGILLATAVEQTLAKGLSVLGIPAPEEM